jgi:hypothetical protein
VNALTWFTQGTYPTFTACSNTGAGGVTRGFWQAYQCESNVSGYVLWVGVEGGSDRWSISVYWSAGRSDNLTGTFGVEGYTHVSTVGEVSVTQASGTVPLNLFWSAAREDNLTTTAASVDGYQHIGVLGYVHSTQQSGTCPLNLYWSSARTDNLTTKAATPPEGYTHVGVVGYAFC